MEINSVKTVGMSTVDGQCVAVPVADQKVATYWSDPSDVFVLGAATNLGKRNLGRCGVVAFNLLNKSISLMLLAGSGYIFYRSFYIKDKEEARRNRIFSILAAGIAVVGPRAGVPLFSKGLQELMGDSRITNLGNLNIRDSVRYLRDNCMDNSGGSRKLSPVEVRKAAKDEDTAMRNAAGMVGVALVVGGMLVLVPIGI